MKQQQNSQNHVTVPICLALWAPNLYVNSFILDGSFERTESQIIVKLHHILGIPVHLLMIKLLYI